MKTHIRKSTITSPLFRTVIAGGITAFALQGTTGNALAAGRASRSTTGSSSSSSGTSTSGASSSGTASRQPPAKPADDQTIQNKAGTTLTDDQKAKIKAAGAALDAAMKAADEAFLSQVAAAVGLSTDTLKAKIQAIAPGRLKGISSNIESLLPQILGRALTDTEKAAIVKAITTWNDAVKSATDAYRAAIDAALGTSSDSGQSGGKGKGGGKGGKCGGNGGGSTGGMTVPGTTTGTTSTDTGTTYKATAYSRRR